MMLMFSPALHHLGLKLRADHIGLDDGEPVLLVDIENPVHAPQIELQVGSLSFIGAAQ